MDDALYLDDEVDEAIDVYDELDDDELDDDLDLLSMDEGEEDAGEAIAQALEDSFLDSMDAANEDEFMARVRGNLQVHGTLQLSRLPGVPPGPGPVRPPVRRNGRPPVVPPQPQGWRDLVLRTLPAAERVVQAGAEGLGGMAGAAIGSRVGRALGGRLGPVGSTIGGAIGGAAGRWGGRALGRWAGGRLTQWARPHVERLLRDGMDGMDAFADLAAENTLSEQDFEAFSGMLSGLSGRFMVRAALPPVDRHFAPQQARGLGRRVMRATQQANEQLFRRYGAASMRMMPRIVRLSLLQAVRRGAPPAAVPGLITRRAQGLLRRPQQARQLARRSPGAIRIRAAAGLPAGRRLPMRVARPRKTQEPELT